MRSRQRYLGVALLLALVAAAVPARDGSADAPASASAALAKLRALAGEWNGSLEWTGARTGKGTIHATYRTTGYGSAVVEDLVSEGVTTMSSVYHEDGADLRMTHYCGARNQPRLKASRIDLRGDAGAIDFAFVDATNLKKPDAPHVVGVELRFADADHFTLTFLFEDAGKKSRERIELTRAARA
jgi:hypothetical protein